MPWRRNLRSCPCLRLPLRTVLSNRSVLNRSIGIPHGICYNSSCTMIGSTRISAVCIHAVYVRFIIKTWFVFLSFYLFFFFSFLNLFFIDFLSMIVVCFVCFVLLTTARFCRLFFSSGVFAYSVVVCTCACVCFVVVIAVFAAERTGYR